MGLTAFSIHSVRKNSKSIESSNVFTSDLFAHHSGISEQSVQSQCVKREKRHSTKSEGKRPRTSTQRMDPPVQKDAVCDYP